MEYRRFENTIIARIDKGEEILEQVKIIALTENIRLASVQALGAVGRYPFRVEKTENLAKGKNISWLFDNEILTLLENEVVESIKGRKTMNFKKEAIKGVYKNALKMTLTLEKNERMI